MLVRIAEDGEAIPLPNQVAFWHPENFSDLEFGVTGEPQWLTCLKATEPFERQIVWQGRNGGGLTAVVDFGESARRGDNRLYYRWGCITTLNPPLSYEEVAANPILGPRLTGRGGRALQGKPVALTEEQSIEIDNVVELPPSYPPLLEPVGDEMTEELVSWRGFKGLEPEAVIEAAVVRTPALWKTLGFPEAPASQRRLLSGRRPDLLAPGVVGEVKRALRVNDGPAQIEEYIEELGRELPEDAPWRGVLLQTADSLDTRTVERIRSSRHSLSAWAVLPTSQGRLKPVRLA